MLKLSNAAFWTATAALGITLGLTATPHSEDLLNEALGKVEVKFSAEYVELSEQEMAEAADVIFVGRVRHISETRWNQDDEQPWESVGWDAGVTALPVHEIEIEVEEKWTDKRPATAPHKALNGVKVDEGRTTTLTLLGNSPWSLHDETHHDLRPGDRAVLFARYTDLAWRDHGTKPVLQLVGVPSQAHYIEEEQGLFHSRRHPDGPKSTDELRRSLFQSRSVQPQI